MREERRWVSTEPETSASAHERGTLRGGIRKPVLAEVAAIQDLVNGSAEDGALLSRTLVELAESVRDFCVYVDEDGVGGCCALHVELLDLAEIRSVVVRKELRSLGVGARLVEACIEEGRALGLPRLYALTRVPGFFVKLGFEEIDMHELPHKVFKDCVRCPLFPDCDEVAMVLDLKIGK